MATADEPGDLEVCRRRPISHPSYGRLKAITGELMGQGGDRMGDQGTSSVSNPEIWHPVLGFLAAIDKYSCASDLLKV